MHHTERLSPALLLVFLLASPTLSQAQDDDDSDPRWRLCPTPRIISPQQLQALDQLPAGVIQGYADHISTQADGTLRMEGRVQLEQRGMQLFSNQAHYNQQTDTVLLIDSVSLRTAELLIEGEQASYQPRLQRGDFSQAGFFLADSHSFGRADSIRVHDNERLELAGLQYTTCPPEQQDWLLRARRLKLNQATNTGEAYHASLSFKGIPFFYSPYLNFPLAGRKSGLLPPVYTNSDSNGTDLTLPFYWNIAPNRDATFSPRHLSRRGNMLGAEFRFLEHNSAGEVFGALLPDDQLTGEDRSELNLRHRARLSAGWRSELRYRKVSDADYYLDDLGIPEDSRNETQLERRFDLRYTDPYWQFLARAQDYQTLAGTSPYQRLPQLQLHGSTPRFNNRLQYRLNSEAVSFRHADRQPTGERYDLKPAIALPLGAPAWFFTPTVAWRHTEYHLQDHVAGDRQERSLPISSVDGGLFFDRPLQLGGQAHTQTLEPRIYYLYVPYRDQDDLPRFDTSLASFSYASLFRDNRFSGADRQGDANQLTLGLSSRLLEDATGKERARIALAQIHYIEQPQVTLLPGQQVAERNRSDLVGELGASPIDRLGLRMTTQWNPYSDQVEQLSAGIRYTPLKGQLLEANYRYYRPDSVRQADFTALWPVGNQWRILAHHYRDLEYRRTMESIAGLEYESCCWTLRLIGKTYRNIVDEPLKRSYMLTMELKGLGSLGRRLEDILGRDILDYD